MASKRKAIPLRTKLAAALACLLPQDLRDDLRARRVDAAVVISLFELHHIEAHAIGGSDHWHNLDPMLKEAHRTRTAKTDIGAISKVKRIERKQAKHLERMNGPSVECAGRLATGSRSIRLGPPKRKIPSRGFPKKPKRQKFWGVGSRPL